MATWHERLIEARKAKGWSRAQMAREVGVSAPTALDWEKGGIQSINGDNLMRVCKSLGITPQWLLHGKTEPTGSIAAWDDLDGLPAEGANHAMVSLYDVEVAAGDGCQWVEHTDADPILFRRRWFEAKRLKPENLRGLYVRGNSMEPVLFDGDVVVIDTTQTDVRDDTIYALLWGQDLLIKRLFTIPGGGLELRSDNDRHKPREARGPDMDQITVLGRMVWRGGSGG